MLLLAVALGCGLVAAIGIRQIVLKADSPGTVDTTPVFVAMKAISYGEKIIISGEDANVKLDAWPTDKVPEGSLTDVADIEDRRAGSRIQPGMPILDVLLLGEGHTNGASVTIPPGFRAHTLKGTSLTAVGDMLRPDDRVDVLLFVKAKDAKALGFDIDTQTITILSNVKIFAVNDQTIREQFDDLETSVSIKNVSLLVEQKQAERLAFAEEIGKLRLTLRGPNEDLVDSSKDEDATSAGDVFERMFQDKSKERGPAANTVAGSLSDLTPSADPVEVKPAGPKPFQIVILEGPKTTVWEHNPVTKRMRKIEGASSTNATTTSAAQANGKTSAGMSVSNAGLPQGEVDLTGLVEESSNPDQ
jgi:pilus assembly protein CpaB